MHDGVMCDSPQQLVLQALLSLPAELGQALPPQLGTRPVQERVLARVPPPHFLEQLDQAVQAAHRPSTARDELLTLLQFTLNYTYDSSWCCMRKTLLPWFLHV